jgi:hypothetical protein
MSFAPTPTPFYAKAVECYLRDLERRVAKLEQGGDITLHATTKYEDTTLGTIFNNTAETLQQHGTAINGLKDRADATDTALATIAGDITEINDNLLIIDGELQDKIDKPSDDRTANGQLVALGVDANGLIVATKALADVDTDLGLASGANITITGKTISAQGGGTGGVVAYGYLLDNTVVIRAVGDQSDKWSYSVNTTGDVSDKCAGRFIENQNITYFDHAAPEYLGLTRGEWYAISSDDVAIGDPATLGSGVVWTETDTAMAGGITLPITTDMIADKAITTAKIGNLAVDTDQIASGAITTAKIGASQITGAKIANSTISDSKITSVNSSKIQVSDGTSNYGVGIYKYITTATVGGGASWGNTYYADTTINLPSGIVDILSVDFDRGTDGQYTFAYYLNTAKTQMTIRAYRPSNWTGSIPFNVRILYNK